MKFPKAFIGVLLISSILFSGWIPGDIRLQTVMQNDGAATSPAKIKGFNTINFTLNYTKLKLTKDQYNSLASNVQYNKDDDKRDGTFRKNDAIVFQFTYASEVYPYPTLRAYPVTFKHQQTSFGNPVNLEYENSKPLPDLSVCNEQVTGDLQITFSDIELLKKQSNSVDPEKYQYLLFTPKYDSSNQHVYFEVSISPSTSPDLIPKTININPSPPYSSNL